MSEITKITDEQAIKALENARKGRTQYATVGVTRTILYPVDIEYKTGKKTTEIRTFVRQGEYCSPRQWELALQLEKQYPKLNKAYRDELKAAKKPIDIKMPNNPLNATPINTR